MLEETSRLVELRRILDTYATALMIAQVDYEEELGKFSTRGANYMRDAFFHLFSYLNEEAESLQAVEENLYLATHAYRSEYFYLRMREVESFANQLAEVVEAGATPTPEDLQLLRQTNGEREGLTQTAAAVASRNADTPGRRQHILDFYAEGGQALNRILDTLDRVKIRLKSQHC